MAAAKGNTQLFTGVRGFITEATDTNFPVDALLDVLNCDIGIDGSIATRPGMVEQVQGSEKLIEDVQENIFSAVRESFTWNDVAGEANLAFEVVRVGLQLYIFQHTATVIDNFVTSINLSTVSGLVINQETATTSYSKATFGNGYMFWANPGMEPFYLEFILDTETVNIYKLTIEIRDFEGIDEGTADDFRPTELSAQHLYNLFNQGWPVVKKDCTFDRKGSAVVNSYPIDYTHDKLQEYPSNSDIFYFARATQAEDAVAINAYSPWVLDDSLTGNTPAPKGNVILQAFDQKRGATQGSSDFAQAIQRWETDTGQLFGSSYVSRTIYEARPGVVEFYSGRAFWGGVNEAGLINNIYFSQVTSKPNKAGRCYQSASPTAEEINDLVDTDGGVLSIQGMANLQDMHVMGSYLILLATNGVWALSGKDGSSFAATNVSVQKISDVGCIGRHASCVLAGRVFYLGDTSMNVVTLDQTGFSVVVENMTETSIKTFYRSIRPEAMLNALLRSVPKENRLYMLYNTQDEADWIDYDGMLIFNLNNGTFTKYQLATYSGIRIFSMFSIRDTAQVLSEDILYDNDGNIITENDDNTIVTIQGTAVVDKEATEKPKFFGIVDAGAGQPCPLIVSHFVSDVYKDWVGRNELSYENYFEMGFNTMGGNPLVGSPIFVNSYFARDMSPQPLEPALLPPTESIRIFQNYVQVLEKL